MPTKDPRTAEPKPLDRAGLKFVSEFRKYRDIYKAAEKAGVARNAAVRIFNTPEFQEELDRQDEAVRMERAKQTVKEESLTNALLDKELATMVQLDPKEHGSLKLDALRLGLVVTGRIQNGSLRSVELFKDHEADGNAPRENFYQAFVKVQEVPSPIVPIEGSPPAAATAQPDPKPPTSPASTPSRIGKIKIG